MNAPPLFSIIVCSLNGERVLPTCLTSLAALRREPTHEIIVVDNGSTDATPRMAAAHPGVRLVQTGRNLGFAGGNNVGMLAARGELLVLLNDDTEVPPDWLARLAEAFERHPRAGAVGCRLLYPDRATIQHAGCRLLPNGNTEHIGYGEKDDERFHAGYACDYVTGAALALRRPALQQAGLLDPGFWPIYFEEVDLQQRLIAAGWTIWYEAPHGLCTTNPRVGTGQPRFVYRYTRNRMRYLALHGAPRGWRAALRAEIPFLRHMMRQGLAVPMLRAYLAGLAHWPAWRLDRTRRRTVPRLS